METDLVKPIVNVHSRHVVQLKAPSLSCGLYSLLRERNWSDLMGLGHFPPLDISPLDIFAPDIPPPGQFPSLLHGVGLLPLLTPLQRANLYKAIYR